MSATGKRILVIDDEESIQRSLRAYLEDEGFEVVSAESGEEGLDILARGPVDAAVVDIRLPGMDGNVFMERAHDQYPWMVFLVCTGSVGYRPPESLRGLGVGDEDVLQKPLGDMSVLVHAIRKRLEERRRP